MVKEDLAILFLGIDAYIDGRLVRNKFSKIITHNIFNLKTLKEESKLPN